MQNDCTSSALPEDPQLQNLNSKILNSCLSSNSNNCLFNNDVADSIIELSTNKIKPSQYYHLGNPFPFQQNEQHNSQIGNPLFLLHINIRSLPKNLDNLNHHLLQLLPSLPDVICLTEIKIKNNPLANINLPGYDNLKFSPAIKIAGGAGIYVSNEYISYITGINELNLAGDCEDIWINIKKQNTNQYFVIGVIYRHPSGNVTNFISALNHKLSQLKCKKFYILGDFNINLLSTKFADPSSEYLNMLWSNSTFQLINKPTRVTKQSTTIIDHILTNDTTNVIYPLILLSDITDHYPTACIISSVAGKKYVPSHYYREFKHFNKDDFLSDLINSIDSFYSTLSLSSSELVDISFDKFVNLFRECIDRHAPIRKASRKKVKLSNKPWITKGIFVSIKKKQKLYVTHYLKGSYLEKLYYKSYSNKLTKLKFISKQSYFRNEILHSQGDSNKLWNIIRKMIADKRSFNSSNCINIDNKLVTDTTLLANYFNDYFSQIGKSITSTNATPTVKFRQFLNNNVSSSMYLHHASVIETYNTIQQLKTKKSNGPDGINSKFVIFAAEIISPILTLLINSCFNFGIFPSCLKIAKVIPVFKKGEKTNLNNYRPISLLSCFSKIMEKIVFKRTIDFLNLHKVISPNQFGFRKNFSTYHPILDIVTNCFDNIENKKFTSLLFLDFTKAFDTVNHQILLSKMECYGIRGIVNSFFSSYLNNRYQFVSLNNIDSKLCKMDIGVPQGSILGPLLFILYINDLPNSVRCVSRLFADDSCLMVTSSSLEMLISSTKKELKNISHWSTANRLILNPSKSNAIFINPKINTPIAKITLSCPFGNINTVSHTKYLGVIIDNKLNFKEHIQFIHSKVSRAVGLLNRIKHFLNLSSLKTLYYSLIHSHFVYSLIVWGNTYSTSLDKLFLIKKKAVRIVSQSFWLESTKPIFSNLQILPLHNLIKFEIGKFIHKYYNNKLPEIFLNYFLKAKNYHNYITRSSSLENLVVPLFKTKKTQFSIKYTGPAVWNSIPFNIKMNSIFKFKKTFKEYLFLN